MIEEAAAVEFEFDRWSFGSLFMSAKPILRSSVIISTKSFLISLPSAFEINMLLALQDFNPFHNERFIIDSNSKAAVLHEVVSSSILLSVATEGIVSDFNFFRRLLISRS